MSIWACSCLANLLSHFSRLHDHVFYLYLLPWSSCAGCPSTIDLHPTSLILISNYLKDILWLPYGTPFDGLFMPSSHLPFWLWLTSQWTFLLDLLSVLTYISVWISRLWETESRPVADDAAVATAFSWVTSANHAQLYLSSMHSYLRGLKALFWSTFYCMALSIPGEHSLLISSLVYSSASLQIIKLISSIIWSFHPL